MTNSSANTTNRSDEQLFHFVYPFYFVMFAAAPPAKPTDKSFTKSSFLVTSLGMQNFLNWILTFDNAQQGVDLEGILALLMHKDDGMDIMLVRYLLLEHSLSVAFGKNGKI
jgi:hypothetical protein